MKKIILSVLCISFSIFIFSCSNKSSSSNPVNNNNNTNTDTDTTNFISVAGTFTSYDAKNNVAVDTLNTNLNFNYPLKGDSLSYNDSTYNIQFYNTISGTIAKNYQLLFKFRFTPGISNYPNSITLVKVIGTLSPLSSVSNFIKTNAVTLTSINNGVRIKGNYTASWVTNDEGASANVSGTFNLKFTK